MVRACVPVCIAAFLFAWFSLVSAQETSSAANAAVPTLISFNGVLTDANGKPVTGATAVTFSLYEEQQGGGALWLESQTVQADNAGRYTVFLGSASAQGLPADLFSSAQARWLGVRMQGEGYEQPRVMLVAVPYALKAQDAQTIGGLPPSAFVLANQSGSAPASLAQTSSSSPSAPPNSAITGSGTVDYIPLWDAASDIISSVLFQSGTGSSAKIGLNTTSPAATLDVNGGIISRGPLELPSTGTATSSQGYNSQPLLLQGSAYNGTSAIGPLFQFQTEPLGNNTTSAAGTLNLLYSNGSGQPAETGLKIANSGLVTFVGTQTFPNTVTSITASNSGITIGGTKTNPTIGINATFANQNYAQLKAVNTFTANQTVNGTMTATTFSGSGASLTNVNATELGGLAANAFAQLAASSNTFIGGVTASSFTGNGAGLTNVNAAELGGFTASAFQPSGSYATLGSNTFNATQTISSGNLSVSSGNLVLPENNGSGSEGVIIVGGNSFIHACCSITAYNTYVGVQAGSLSLQAANNTTEGAFSLASLTQGQSNTASGFNSLGFDNTGSSNAAFGVDSLEFTSSGGNNTAVGVQAGVSANNSNANTTGSNNTFLGYQSGPGTATQLTNATAIGANAVVSENNAVVLGSVAGLNNATANTNVGIGTTTPAYSLDVHGSGNFTGLITFASNQTFPGTGTITGVTSGTGLSGGGNSGSVTLTNTGLLSLTAGTGISSTGGQSPTLSVNPSVVPELSASNTFTGNQTVNGNLSASGVVTGSSFQIGSNLFAFGSTVYDSAFLGFAGNSASVGNNDTATGYQAFFSNTSGGANTATGGAALYSNTTGNNNTSSGFASLFANTTGGGNTASGGWALSANTTGSLNTAYGLEALETNTTGSGNTATGELAFEFVTTGNFNTATGMAAGTPADASPLTGSNNTLIGYYTELSTGSLSNATAIGANAQVAASNSLVLGSIYGVNNAAASTNVGIGITAPTYLLHVGTANNGFRVEGPVKGTVFPTLASFGGTGDFSIDGFLAPEGRFVVKDSSGYVGINTAYPDAYLSVNGSADKPGGGSWGTFSDRRLKNLDGNFAPGLEQIMQINPVRYRYKKENGMGIQDTEEHVGVVAQEIQRVIPDAVSQNNKGYLLVNNDPIIWAMLNAIKEQQKQVAEQRDQIRGQQQQIRTQQKLTNAQQHEIASLRAQVTVLRAKSLSDQGQRKVRAAKTMVRNIAVGQ